MLVLPWNLRACPSALQVAGGAGGEGVTSAWRMHS